MKKTYQFKLKGSSFLMEVEEHDPHSINTIRYRPDKYIPKTNPSIPMRELLAITDKLEFTMDMKSQLSYLNRISGDITGDHFIEALFHACSKHIDVYKRLIDTDLYTYIDINMHILDSIMHLPIDQIKNIYSSVAVATINQYENYFYISDPILGLKKYKR